MFVFVFTLYEGKDSVSLPPLVLDLAQYLEHDTFGKCLDLISYHLGRDLLFRCLYHMVGGVAPEPNPFQSVLPPGETDLPGCVLLWAT